MGNLRRARLEIALLLRSCCVGPFCIFLLFARLPEQFIVIRPRSHFAEALSRKSRFEAALKDVDTQVRAVKLAVQPMLYEYRIHPL